MPTDNIPTTAMPIIHDLDVIRVDVRMSALGPGLRTLVEKLTEELHEARAHLYNARQSRDEYLDELEEIRSLLGAGPGVTALEAVKQAQGEHAETLTALAKARQERNEARAELSIERDITRELRASLKIPNGVSLTGTVKRLAEERDEALEALAKATASLETERIAGRVATEFWQARIATLESAIRTLGKVLP